MGETTDELGEGRCNLWQEHLFSRPVPLESVERLMTLLLALPPWRGAVQAQGVAGYGGTCPPWASALATANISSRSICSGSRGTRS